MPGPSPFTRDDVEQILRVVDRLTDVEVTLEAGDFRLHVRKFSGPAPLPEDAPAAAPFSVPAALRVQPAASKPSAARIPEGAVAIRAPMLGTFYRAPSPTEPPYVEVGKRVAVGDPVCVIEVMKLFNTVNAEIGGTILEVAAENGAMVEYNQILFVVQPGA
jgi:acetyl-CoA carboxylase biotin carboxyl carrier protein